MRPKENIFLILLSLLFSLIFISGCQQLGNMVAFPASPDPIIGTWIQQLQNGGYDRVEFESNGTWSSQEFYNGGNKDKLVLRSIPPWYGTWKKMAKGMYSVDQSGSVSLWDYNASQDTIFPDEAKTQIYYRVNSSEKSTG